jgi:hypothetical protein
MIKLAHKTHLRPKNLYDTRRKKKSEKEFSNGDKKKLSKQVLLSPSKFQETLVFSEIRINLDFFF